MRDNGFLNVGSSLPPAVLHKREPVPDTYQVIKIISGEWYVSTRPGEMLDTILGSCVAACIRDPYARIGGMNHFLLPGEGNATGMSDGARYGVFAMESLINGILKAGGRKERLEVKVFGGGNVTSNSARIGSKNAAFIRDYLAREGLPICSQNLEGHLPRRVNYFPDTGRVRMRMLHSAEQSGLVETENHYRATLMAKPVGGEVDLF